MNESMPMPMMQNDDGMELPKAASLVATDTMGLTAGKEAMPMTNGTMQMTAEEGISSNGKSALMEVMESGED